VLERRIFNSQPKRAPLDRLYPQLRPARVKVTTARGVFTRAADEALGSRLVPLDDGGLKAKFLDLAGPELSSARAARLGDLLWEVETCGDIRPVVEAAAR
jgi:2-methylcitrate dehydratase PrpD